MINKTAILLLLFFASTYCFLSIGHFGGDGYEDYLTAESIVLDGNLSLLDRPNDPDELQYKSKIGIPGKGGKIYSARGSLGVPVLLAPFYAVGHLLSKLFTKVPHDYITMLSVSFYNPVVSAVNVFLVFCLSVLLGYKRKISLAVSFIYGLCTMAPVYARTGFAEPTLVMFLLLSILFLFRYKRRMNMLDLCLAILSFVLCILSKPVSLMFSPFLFGYFLWITIENEKNDIAVILKSVLFVLGVSLGCFFVFVLNYAIYGKILSLGAYNIADNAARIASSKHFIKGIYYYLISTGKGLFIYNVPFILCLFMVAKSIKEKNKENILFFVLFIVNLLFYVKSFRRGSLFSWGPRYLLPSLPLLALILAGYVSDLKGVISRFSIWFLSIIGFFIMMPCMLVNQSKFYFFVVEKLRLDEYMINFIPDLSPIKGAWSMLISRILAPGMSFLYAPDWRLVKPISASMEGYNYIDLWFVKIISYAPGYQNIVLALAGIFILVSILSLYGVLKTNES